MSKEKKKKKKVYAFLAGFCILAPYFDSISPPSFICPFQQIMHAEVVWNWYVCLVLE